MPDPYRTPGRPFVEPQPKPLVVQGETVGVVVPDTQPRPRERDPLRDVMETVFRARIQFEVSEAKARARQRRIEARKAEAKRRARVGRFL